MMGGAGGGQSGTTGTTPQQGGNPFAMLQQMMANMPQGGGRGGGGAAAPQQSVRPEIVYRDQLRQLNEMGFTNASANLNALIATGGNLEAAVDRLITGQFS